MTRKYPRVIRRRHRSLMCRLVFLRKDHPNSSRRHRWRYRPDSLWKSRQAYQMRSDAVLYTCKEEP